MRRKNPTAREVAEAGLPEPRSTPPMPAIAPAKASTAPASALAGALGVVAVRDIRNAQQSMESAINATPTGALRNKLCDMNIQLMEMHNTLIKVLR